MINNFKAASILSKVKRTEQELKDLTLFFDSIEGNENEQNKFFDYCKKWKLAPWAYTQIGRFKLSNKLMPEVLARFDESHKAIQLQNEKRNQEALRFLKEFKKHNIDVVVLKGNLLAHKIYKDKGYKRMNDFDILIHMGDWDKIQDIYLELGYIPLGFGWSGEKEKAAKFSHVGMSYISPDYSCIIGSQWGLKSPTTNFNVDINEAWKTAVDFDFFGINIKQLSPEYNLLHLVLHMGIFKCGIRDCMDVYNLILEENIDWKKFDKIIHVANAVDKTNFTLKMSELCAGQLIPDDYKIDYTPKTFVTRRLNKRLKAFELNNDFHLSYNDYFQDVEKIVIYFNLFPKFHKKLGYYLKILISIYFPNTEIALKLSDIPGEKSFFKKLKAKIKAPYYVFALISQEIGPKFTFLLFMKLYFDLIISLKNYFVKKESYFDYLCKKGVDYQEIEKVVKNIQ